MKITVFDYGAGNLHSLTKAIAAVAEPPAVETDSTRLAHTDVLVLPGVGAFAPAAVRLAPGRERLREALDRGLPCLGICLGMQLFFERSDEGPGEGLGFFRGPVDPLRAPCRPQIGWNEVAGDDPLLRDTDFQFGYYANGFACRPMEPDVVSGWSDYQGDRFPAIVRRAGTVGVQFHPEKSSAPGLALLEAFFRGVVR